MCLRKLHWLPTHLHAALVLWLEKSLLLCLRQHLTVLSLHRLGLGLTKHISAFHICIIWLRLRRTRLDKVGAIWSGEALRLLNLHQLLWLLTSGCQVVASTRVLLRKLLLLGLSKQLRVALSQHVGLSVHILTQKKLLLGLLLLLRLLLHILGGHLSK